MRSGRAYYTQVRVFSHAQFTVKGQGREDKWMSQGSMRISKTSASPSPTNPRETPSTLGLRALPGGVIKISSNTAHAKEEERRLVGQEEVYKTKPRSLNQKRDTDYRRKKATSICLCAPQVCGSDVLCELSGRNYSLGLVMQNMSNRVLWWCRKRCSRLPEK
eukprot:scaffold260185_cov33-Tisochrysis_lutea.AAC.7